MKDTTPTCHVTGTMIQRVHVDPIKKVGSLFFLPKNKVYYKNTYIHV